MFEYSAALHLVTSSPFDGEDVSKNPMLVQVVNQIFGPGACRAISGGSYVIGSSL